MGAKKDCCVAARGSVYVADIVVLIGMLETIGDGDWGR